MVFKLFFSAILLFSFCKQRNKVETQLKSLPVTPASYTEDSIRVINILRKDLKEKKDIFSSNEYFESTQILIDTIIYGPGEKKFAVFVVIKNPTSRQLIPDARSDWYYNGNCYMGIKKMKDSILLSSTGPIFTNSINLKELVLSMRSEYLSIFARLKDGNGNLRYKYNIGDSLFWTCPIWDEVEKKEARRQTFEKSKKERPEDFYDKTPK